MRDAALTGVKYHTLDRKFGRNDAVGTTFEPVCYGGNYRMPTSATSLQIKSSGASGGDDTNAGTGARQITVTGINANCEEVSQTVNTDGTTAVPLSTDLLRVYRVAIPQSGTYADISNGSHAGEIIVEDGSLNEWARIDVTDFPKGQSEIAWRAVPVGYKMFIWSIEITVDTSKATDVMLLSRSSLDTVSAPFSQMRMHYLWAGLKEPIPHESRIIPYVIDEKSDVGFMAKVDSTTASVSVEFLYELIDNDNFFSKIRDDSILQKEYNHYIP